MMRGVAEISIWVGSASMCCSECGAAVKRAAARARQCTICMALFDHIELLMPSGARVLEPLREAAPRHTDLRTGRADGLVGTVGRSKL